MSRRTYAGATPWCWTQALRHNNLEVAQERESVVATANRAHKLNGKPPAPAPIRARARYAECCARKGDLSKANQAMTSDLTPSAAPININELRAKNPRSPPTPTGTPPHNRRRSSGLRRPTPVRGGRRKTVKSTFSSTSVSSTSPSTSAHARRCQQRTLTGGVRAN